MSKKCLEFRFVTQYSRKAGPTATFPRSESAADRVTHSWDNKTCSFFQRGDFIPCKTRNGSDRDKRDTSVAWTKKERSSPASAPLNTDITNCTSARLPRSWPATSLEQIKMALTFDDGQWLARGGGFCKTTYRVHARTRMPQDHGERGGCLFDFN